MKSHRTAVYHIVLAMLSLSIVCPTFAAPQGNEDTKWIYDIKLAKCADIIKKYEDKGMYPVDAQVDSNGKRVRFSLGFAKPAKLLDKTPICLFDIRASKYDARTEQASKEKYKVHWQEEYMLKGEKYHACIWLYDEDYEPTKDLKTKKEVSQPPAKPLGKVWEVNSKVPTSGVGHAAYAGLENEALLFVKANQIAGGSIACSLNGEIAYQRSLGFSDIDRKKALKPSQPMRIVGISRLLTAVAVLQLADRGKLQLDQKAFKILDHIEAWKPKDVDDTIYEITVLHLLQDSGGYDEERTDFIPALKPRTIAKAMDLEHPITNEQVISYMMSKSLAFEPGTKGQYSDFGYCLLGRIIEKISGMPYAEYVEKNIIKPYKLGFQMGHGDLARRAKNEPMYYSRLGVYFYQVTGKDIDKWVQYPDGGVNLDLLDTSAGWIGTTEDILRFAALLQLSQADATRLRIKPLLSDAARVQLVAKPEYYLKAPAGKDYWRGCSVRSRDYVGGRTFWIKSSRFGASAALTCYANGISYCHLWNCSTTESGTRTCTVFGELIKKEAFAARDILIGK